MGKPKVIGYETNHNLTYSTPNLPEMTYDSKGISIPWQYTGKDGRQFQAPRYLTDIEVDELMRECGMKRVYEERQFHAKQNGGTCQIHCKRCKTTTWTGSRYPHDVAADHHCLYDPRKMQDADEA